MAFKQAVVKRVAGITLLGKSDSNHWVVMDSGEASGGSRAGSTPKELLMMALAGCTAMDVIPILTKKKVPFEDFEIRVTGNTREEHPQVFTNLHIEYIVYGSNIDQKDVERAIELSTTKYCAVSAMLRPGVEITHSYVVKPARETASV